MRHKIVNFLRWLANTVENDPYSVVIKAPKGYDVTISYPQKYKELNNDLR